MQADGLQLGQRGALGLGDVRLAHVGVGVEDVVVGRRDVDVAHHDGRGRVAGGHHVAQPGEPGQLVVVVLGVRRAPVGDVDRHHADAAARGRHRPRLRVREAGRAVAEAGDDVLEPDAREDRHAVPRGLAVQGDLVATVGQLAAQQRGERIVGELGLLEGDDVGLALVKPRQQARDALLGGVHVPGDDAHGH